MNRKEKAAAWDRIAAAWALYCREGADAFDWDFDSRDLMEQLTNIEVTYWYRPIERPSSDH